MFWKIQDSEDRRQNKTQLNKTTVYYPGSVAFMTLGREMRWAYSTTLPSPHGACRTWSNTDLPISDHLNVDEYSRDAEPTYNTLQHGISGQTDRPQSTCLNRSAHYILGVCWWEKLQQHPQPASVTNLITRCTWLESVRPSVCIDYTVDAAMIATATKRISTDVLCTPVRNTALNRISNSKLIIYVIHMQGWNCRGFGVDPPQFMSTDAHFWVKIGFKFQSLGKISHISTSDPQFFSFQHCTVHMLWTMVTTTCVYTASVIFYNKSTSYR